MKKKIFLIFSLLVLIRLNVTVAYADTAGGMNYLQTQQDSTGKITGFGGESQWAAIAFAENGIDISSVKKSGVSLKDFLLTDVPSAGAAATEWERRILAIVATGGDPTDFGGINYLKKVESLVNNDQLGDTSLLNDDIFGLLALIASGSSADKEIKQKVLNYIIEHQNSAGGFSWSTNPSFNTSDSNDTAAAMQALKAAQKDQLSNDSLNSSLEKAKNYLLGLQVTNGGFKYDTSPWSSDPDAASTAWALMALNVIDLGNGTEAMNAKIWLNTQQEPDGGFHWMSGSGSDTATTSYALIALSGNGLLFFPQSIALSPAETISPITVLTNTPQTSSPTVTPTSIQSQQCQDSKPETPVITNVEIVNDTTVVLHWEKINDPVSYYLLAYGTSADTFEYGNPNIGGKETTRYTVSSLPSGKTYYFKIRAGNGCRPGDFSNMAVVDLSPVSPTPTTTVQPSMLPEPTEKRQEMAVLGVKTDEPNQTTPLPFVYVTIAMFLLAGAGIYWYLKMRG